MDFYSGLVYRKLGIPTDLFTPIFAIARVAGWLAHWKEQLAENRIFRPTQIYTGPHEQGYTHVSERIHLWDKQTQPSTATHNGSV